MERKYFDRNKNEIRMNPNTEYFEVRTIRELHGIYYVAAESKEQAEELAWERFGVDDERLRLESDWEYDTITRSLDSQDSDEWLVEDEDGEPVWVEAEEDFLAAVNNGGEV